MERHRKRRAIEQAGALLLVFTVLLAVAFVVARRPADPTALSAEVAILRSQAAEAVLLNDLRARLPARFVRAHAMQLADIVHDESEQVRDMQVQPAIVPAAVATRAASMRLATLVDIVRTEPGRFDRAAARNVVDTLAAIEHELRR